MLFNSLQYFIFLPIVLILYFSLPHKAQNRMLLVASYIFYSFWDYRFLVLIFLSTTVDYFVGLAIDQASTPGKRKLYLTASLAVNLGILGFFKYFNFFIDNASRLLSLAGVHGDIPFLYVILPVGVSFYTFQEITYTVGVYRREMKPVRDFLDFALYVCYFPQLVAGPIERAYHLIPKFQAKRVVDKEQFISGCVLILIGLFRKVVIADGIAAHVSTIFADPGAHNSPQLIMGIYLFAMQIYCDFAGYSDIARGTSRLLGIELMENFNHPYFSANISEFWRRWHISLSSWLRDYLYIPLGGNRGSKLMTYRNLMVTMLLGGLWHGASWNFVIWGGLHGLYQVGHRMLHGSKSGQVRKEGAGIVDRWDLRRVLSVLVTFHLVLLTWVFFRAPGFIAAMNYLRGIFSFRGMETLLSVLPAILIPAFLILLVDVPQYLGRNHVVLLRWPKMTRNLAVAAMLFLILLGFGTHAPFIYFQF